MTYVHHLQVVDWGQRRKLSVRERQVLAQMRRATRMLLKRAPHLIVMTPRLAAEVARWRPGPVEIVPMGIDASLYSPMSGETSPAVGLIGSMFWWPSRSAAERLLALWPRINAQAPHAELLIGGWDAKAYLGNWFPLEGARLIERVDDPSSFFRQISMLVYPIPRGTGMKVKVLEALAYGLPVVTTADGAEGIRADNVAGIVLATSDDEFIEQTSALLRDQQRRRDLGAAGRRFVEEQLAPEVTVDRLLEAYGRLGLV